MNHNARPRYRWGLVPLSRARVLALPSGAEMKRNRIIKKRNRLADALDRAAIPERPFRGRGPRYLVHPTVTVACAPSLRMIAAAMRDETLVLDADGLRAVWTFITDGQSPFFRRDVAEALSEAVRLQQLVCGAETAVHEEERVPRHVPNQAPGRELVMERIRCDIDESEEGIEGVRDAVAFCREHGTKLELVGVVRTSMFDPPQPAHGELVRRFNEVQHRLVQAIEIAQSAGITPTVALRAGNLDHGLVRAGGAFGAFARLRSSAKARTSRAVSRGLALRPDH